VRHRTTAIVESLGLAVVLTPLAPADARPLPRRDPSGAATAALAKFCRSGRAGVIDWRRICLDRWQVCNRRYEKQYERYNLTCDLLAKGRYHLDYTYYPGDLSPAQAIAPPTGRAHPAATARPSAARRPGVLRRRKDLCRKSGMDGPELTRSGGPGEDEVVDA
jgi:hypothetical protein